MQSHPSGREGAGACQTQGQSAQHFCVGVNTGLDSIASMRLGYMSAASGASHRVSRLCAASAVSTYGEVPGAAGRWTLADVDTGLDSMAAMYAAVDSMSNQIVLFTTLQGITMQLLILRLIRVLSAQKRLSILTSTTIKVASHPCFHAMLAGLCCAFAALLTALPSGWRHTLASCYACWAVLCFCCSLDSTAIKVAPYTCFMLCLLGCAVLGCAVLCFCCSGKV